MPTREHTHLTVCNSVGPKPIELITTDYMIVFTITPSVIKASLELLVSVQ